MRKLKYITLLTNFTSLFVVYRISITFDFQDLTEFLHVPENHKMLTTIKGNIDRGKRMARNSSKNKFSTPQPSRFISHLNNTLNTTVCSSASDDSILLPAIEPDYGITRADKPRYFEDAQQAIKCLFRTYKL